MSDNPIDHAAMTPEQEAQTERWKEWMRRRMVPVRIIDIKPIGHTHRLGPIYSFSTSYPASGIRMTGPVCETPEEAALHGRNAIAEYCRSDPYGNMGEVCGVTRVDGGYRAVINTYHSNS